jgi:hypothetical protein
MAKPSAKKDWGLLEPAHSVLGPLVDALKPLLTGNLVYGLLVGLLVTAWFGFGTKWERMRVGGGNELAFANYPQRLAAYEQMWKHEESELWDWIEERVGLERLNSGAMPVVQRRASEQRTVEDKLRDEKMDEREVREAIRVTEEKLRVLKSAVEKGGRMENL